jgi:hypothetical protein
LRSRQSNLNVIPHLKFQLLGVVVVTRKETVFRAKNRHFCLFQLSVVYVV